MIPQVVTNETVTVISPNGVNFPQTDTSQPTHQMQDNLKKCLKAEIKVIAAIQIMCGVMVLSLGIILASAPIILPFPSVISVLLNSSYPFAGALCFIISGTLSVIREKKSTKFLVEGSLITNILSILFAFMGIVIISVNLAGLHPALEKCEQLRPTDSYYYYFSLNNCFSSKNVLTGVLSLMLVFSVLELGLAMLAAMLWWK
ncbi:hypothetical protein U0070_016095 [Myodes glareolus]|uniref:Membrane-spanning 4-domains subfamily A member 6A n=1 Tax=Myodes glareolus TaxID=447135 RepID=A0AAW0H1W1_MYOGA